MQDDDLDGIQGDAGGTPGPANGPWLWLGLEGKWAEGGTRSKRDSFTISTWAVRGMTRREMGIS